MRVPFPASSGKDSDFPVAQQDDVLSTGMSRGTPGDVPPFQRTPKCRSPLQMNLISLPFLEGHTEHRITPLWHVRQPCGTARKSHRSLCQLVGKPHIAPTAWEDNGRVCLHSRRVLTLLWRLQRNPKIHVSTGEETSGSGRSSSQGRRNRHDWRGIPRGPSQLAWRLVFPEATPAGR